MTRHRDSDENDGSRHPMHRMVAIIDDRTAVQAALVGLAEAGIETSEVADLSGERGMAALDPRGERHGPVGRLHRLAQWTAAEGTELAVHRQALAAGKHVVYVPANGQHQKDDVAAVLAAVGGHHLAYFGRRTVERSAGPK